MEKTGARELQRRRLGVVVNGEEGGGNEHGWQCRGRENWRQRAREGAQHEVGRSAWVGKETFVAFLIRAKRNQESRKLKNEKNFSVPPFQSRLSKIWS